MRRILSAACMLAALCGCAGTSAPTFEWRAPLLDGSFTGVVVPRADNVAEALGIVDEDGTYRAPNGRIFRDGATPEVARLMIEAQPRMAGVKAVLGTATRTMKRFRPQCELGNMVVDCVMSAAEEFSGRKVDVGLCNLGGIRIDIEEGPVLLDDVLSMLPFRNYVCYLEVRGRDLLRLFSQLAAGPMQPVGGVQLAVKDGCLVQALVGGKPVEADRWYGFATIDFLLDGGDNIHAADGARVVLRSDILVREALLSFFDKLRAEGKPIEYSIDDRVKVL